MAKITVPEGITFRLGGGYYRVEALTELFARGGAGQEVPLAIRNDDCIDNADLTPHRHYCQLWHTAQMRLSNPAAMTCEQFDVAVANLKRNAPDMEADIDEALSDLNGRTLNVAAFVRKLRTLAINAGEIPEDYRPLDPFSS